MSSWSPEILLLIYVVSTYYFFLRYSVKKAVLLVFTSTTVFFSSLMYFLGENTSLYQNITNSFYSAPIIQQTQERIVQEVPELNILQVNDVTLSKIKTHQWGEGNSLYVLNGEIQNNSEYPIHSLNIEIRLSDCGPKDMKTECSRIVDNIHTELSKLNIQPHQKAEFDSSYAIDHPDHHYEIEVYFTGAKSVVKILPTPPTHVAIEKGNAEKKENIDLDKILDRMPICGGGADVDEPEIKKGSDGKIMLAETLENYPRRDRGC